MGEPTLILNGDVYRALQDDMLRDAGYGYLLHLPLLRGLLIQYVCQRG